MTVEATEVGGRVPTLEDWEDYASSDPQPRGEVAYETPAVTVLRYKHPHGGAYYIVWIARATPLLPWREWISELQWATPGSPVFYVGSGWIDQDRTELVWFSPAK